jgi:putative PEP-CTERM system TPR-repeat lipoprotein
MRTPIACTLLLASLVVFSTACSRGRPDPAAHIAAGDRYLAEEKFGEAVVEYRNAVGADDRSGEARFKLAEAYARVGDGQNAYREYIRAADLLPDDVQAQVKAGTFLAMSGQFEDAKTRAQRALALEPANVEAQILLGNVLAGMKDLDGAISQIEEAIQIDPARGLSYTNLGVIRQAQGDRDAARAAFERAVEVDPKSAIARLSLANFQLQGGEVEGAEASLKAALALEPAHEGGNRALAMLYLASNRAPEAEPYLKTVAETAKTPAAKFGLADYYLFTNRVADARATLQPLADEDATSAEARARLAQIDYAAGERAAAHAAIEGVLSRSPNYAPAMLISARWLHAEGKREEAQARAQAAVKAAPDSPAGHYLLGMIQADARDVPSAISSFNEVLRLNPRVAAAQMHLSRLQLSQGATQSAVQFAESALQNAPADAMARLTLAGALLAQRDYARADPMVAALLKEYPQAPPVQALEGMRHLSRKNLPQARAAFDRALQGDPGNFVALSGLTSIDVAERKVPSALARVEGRLAAAPNEVPVLLLAANVYVTANEPAKAEKALRRAVELAPADSTAYGMLGQLYIAQRRINEAQAEFDIIVSRNPKNVGARTIAAMLAHTKNDIEDAKRRYREVLEVEPTAAVAANNLAWIYAEEGTDLDEALRLAQMAAAQVPDRAEIHDTVGWVYYRKELPSLAIAPFERSVAQQPDNPTYHYHLALAHAKSGNTVQARLAAQAALRVKPDYAEARALLDTLKD